MTLESPKEVVYLVLLLVVQMGLSFGGKTSTFPALWKPKPPLLSNPSVHSEGLDLRVDSVAKTPSRLTPVCA